MAERTIKTTKVGFKWLAHYADDPGSIGIGSSEIAAIGDLQNLAARAAEDEAGENAGITQAPAS